MAQKLKFDGFTDDDLAPILEKQADYHDLMKLALENCDAVMQCSPNVDEAVLEMVKESKLPFLPFEECENTEMVNRAMEFYRSL